MIGLSEWIASNRFADKPWLLLGKGPTFSRLGDIDLGDYNVMSLNHVVNEVPVDVAHIMDLDVVEACADRLLDNCRYLLMPRVPHVQVRNSLLVLDDFVEVIPVLKQLDEQNRLVWYNTEVDRQFPGSPVVDVRYFSSEAAFNVLALMGARTVRSLGVDGGQSYSSTFEVLSGATRLVNNQPSFDLQFPEIEKTARRHGIDYRPIVEPIRIFVGTEDNQMPAARVLEHTIRQTTKHPVRVEFIRNYDGPMPKHRRNQPRTTFSFCRFEIPARCGYQGRAIYMDADMQVFADVEELWTRPFNGHSVMLTRQDEPPEAWKISSLFHPGRQMSVMVLDCARLRWDIEEIVRGLDEGRYTYQDLMFDLCIVPHDDIDDTLPPEWNHLERHDPGITKLTHYTVVPTQPWKNDENPLKNLWFPAYQEAVAAGAIVPAEVEQLAKAGEIKPAMVDELASLPRRPFPVASAAEMELAAAFRRLDELQRRTVKGRVHTLYGRARPLVQSLRDNSDRGRLIATADRLVTRLRRALR
jgi:hypothetical protein